MPFEGRGFYRTAGDAKRINDGLTRRRNEEGI
jgi:hypothetical protein